MTRMRVRFVRGRLPGERLGSFRQPLRNLCTTQALVGGGRWAVDGGETDLYASDHRPPSTVHSLAVSPEIVLGRHLSVVVLAHISGDLASPCAFARVRRRLFHRADAEVDRC